MTGNRPSTARHVLVYALELCLLMSIVVAIGACRKQDDSSEAKTQDTGPSSELSTSGRIMPGFAQYILDGAETVRAKGHSEWTTFDYRIANRQPFTAAGRYQRRIPSSGTMDYDFRYAADHLYLRPRNLLTGEMLITGASIHHPLTQEWVKAQAARIQGKWVLGVDGDNRLNGNITIDQIRPFGVFSSNAVGGFHNNEKEWQRSDKVVDGVKVAAFREPDGDELDLALAGDHLPVRAIYKSNGNFVVHLSDYNAPLHVKAPANPIDLAKL